MKKMMSDLSLFVVLTLGLVSPAFAGAAPEIAMGKAQYTRWNMPDIRDTNGDLGGLIVLSGDVAAMMWDHMTNATFNAGAPDLEQRKPSQIGRHECPSKTGVNVACRKIPAFMKDEDAFLRDHEGKVVYNTRCDLDIADVTRGKFAVLPR